MHDGDGMGGQESGRSPYSLGGAPTSAPQAKKNFGRNTVFTAFLLILGGSGGVLCPRPQCLRAAAWPPPLLGCSSSSLPPLPLRCRARLLPVVVLILVVLLILSWLCQWEQLAVALAATRAAMQLCIGQRWNPAQWSPIRDTSSTETHR